MRKLFLLLNFLWIPAFADHTSPIIEPVIVRPLNPLSLSTGPQNFITQQQFIQQGDSSLTQTLQSLGGVQLHDLTGTNNQVLLGMRGFGANASSNTLLLINGIPITNPDLAPPDLNIIPLAEIRAIEIISGSESVLYGDQAVGGVINILTKDIDHSHPSMSCSAGNYAQHHCYIAYNNVFKQWQYSFNLANDHTDNYRDHNNYDQSHLFGQWVYTYPSGQLNLNYRIAKETLQYPGALTADQVAQNRRQASNSTDFFDDWNGIVQLHHQQMLDNDWWLITDASTRDMQGSGVLSSDFSQSRHILWIKPHLEGEWSRMKWYGGLEASQDQYHLTTDFGITNDRQQQYGAFVLWNFHYTDRLVFSWGGREAQQTTHLTASDDVNNVNRANATTMGISYQLLPDTQLYLRRAGSFRFPKADENASTLPEVDGLKTQRGVAYETGITLEHNNYSAKINVFQLNLHDEIAFDPFQTPEQPFGSNRNLAPTIRRGLTVSGRACLTDKLILNGQYNDVNARFQSGINAGNRIPLVAEQTARAGILYQFTPAWSVYNEAQFTGNEFPDNDDANIGRKLGGYTVYNVNLRYQHKNLSASFRVNNIFNKYYYFYSVFQTSSATDFFYPAPARNLLLTVQYDFV